MACRKLCLLSSATFGVVLLMLSSFLLAAEAAKKKNEKKAHKIGKDITDYTDADVHRLLDQWDVSCCWLGLKCSRPIFA